MSIEKIITIMVIILFMATPVSAINVNHSTQSIDKITCASSYIDTINPLKVHASAVNSSWKSYFHAGTYFLNLASDRPFKTYFNLSVIGAGFNETFFTNNYVFHGIIFNQSGIYNITSTGQGKWLFSLCAQDPNHMYRSNISAPTSFVIVPDLGNSSHIEINFQNNYLISVTVFNELLNSIHSTGISENTTIFLNLTGDYDGILFLSVSPENNNTFLNIAWAPIKDKHNTHTANPIINYAGIVVIVSIVIALGLFLYKGNSNRKKRRR